MYRLQWYVSVGIGWYVFCNFLSCLTLIRTWGVRVWLNVSVHNSAFVYLCTTIFGLYIIPSSTIMAPVSKPAPRPEAKHNKPVYRKLKKDDTVECICGKLVYASNFGRHVSDCPKHLSATALKRKRKEDKVKRRKRRPTSDQKLRKTIRTKMRTWDKVRHPPGLPDVCEKPVFKVKDLMFRLKVVRNDLPHPFLIPWREKDWFSEERMNC